MRLLLLLVCSQLLTEKPAVVTLQVLDEHHAPMAAVLVSVEGLERSTDARGQVVLQLSPGRHLVRLAPDEADQIGTMSTMLEAKSGASRQTLVFQSDEPHSQVSVRVRASDGGVIAPKLEATLGARRISWIYCFEASAPRTLLRDTTIVASISVDSAGALRAASLLHATSPEVGACVVAVLQKLAVAGKTPVTSAVVEVQFTYGVR